MKIIKKENSNNIFCFYPERAPQKAISKSTVRTVIALANKRQGRTRLNLRQLYLYLVLVFTFVFKLFKQASHYLNDNSGILSVRISSYFTKISISIQNLAYIHFL